jgi:hypothetical protein
MRQILPILLTVIMTTLSGCHKKDAASDELTPSMYDVEVEIKGDSMLYGLTCDGTSDSVVVIWPFSGNPITLNCIDAKQNHRIIGKPEIGDWIGVMRSQEDSMDATMVINLDQLKGTWTYPVLPVMKELQSMSRRTQRRMMADMPDSIRNTFFVPREYGFTLKRLHQAQSVGRVMRNNTLEDDSPVIYPEVKNYRKWYMLNGRLLLVSAKRASKDSNSKDVKPIAVLDTLEFIHMSEDSLILTLHGKQYGFHRKNSSLEANAEAIKAQEKIDNKNKNKK